LRLPAPENTVPRLEGPSVFVAFGSVILDGTEGSGHESPILSERTSQTEDLFEGLKAIRENFMRVHGGATFPGVINLWVDGSSPAGAVKNVLRTAFRAGFPNVCFVVRVATESSELGCINVEAGIPKEPERRPPESVAATVHSNYSELRRCYEAALFRRAGVTGVVVVRFKIAPDGRVVDARDVNSTLPDPVAVQCVVAMFRRFQFAPGGDEPESVVYPVVFEPKN
jgi:TonB family protein